ncbi:hypothetical protein NBRC116590_36790 [Pelagimonas sp. KU-00592-HH]
MTRMKPLVIALCACLASGPVWAEEQAENGSEDSGLTLMERGALLFFEGLMDQMEPALDELGTLAEEAGPALRQFAEEMGPALAELMAEIEDWSVYHPPEMLPNGDIIIRRKQPEPTPEEGTEDGAVDL